MEKVITQETIKTMTDDELQRKANDAWYFGAVDLSWLIQEEIIRRRNVKD